MANSTVGIVGCGHISQTHIRAWQRAPQCSIGGVLDVNRDLAEQRASQFGIGKVYEGLEAMLADCDVVDVCTPPQTHAAIAEQVLTANRHLLIEKPVVTSVADWDQLSAVAKRSEGRMVVVHNVKFGHPVIEAKQWVDSGAIGHIVRLEHRFLTDPSNDRMLVGDSHWSHTLPGGRWHETLPHALYLIHYFLGPLEVAGVTAIRTPDAPAGAPVSEVLIAFRGERALATVQYSAHSRENLRTLEIFGTDGSIDIDLLSSAGRLSTRRESKWKRAVGYPYMDAANQLVRMIPERSRYAVRRVRKETPHLSIIQAASRYFRGEGESPSPLDEIDYVVRRCDEIGRLIDAVP